MLIFIIFTFKAINMMSQKGSKITYYGFLKVKVEVKVTSTTSIAIMFRPGMAGLPALSRPKFGSKNVIFGPNGHFVTPIISSCYRKLMSVFSFPHLDMLGKVLEKIKTSGTQLLEHPQRCNSELFRKIYFSKIAPKSYFLGSKWSLNVLMTWEIIKYAL